MKNKMSQICCQYIKIIILSSVRQGSYDYREMSSMMSQLILNLDTSDNGVYYNGESVCLALCNIAKLHAENVSITSDML